MKTLPRLLRLLRPFAGQVAVAALLGVATVVCGIGLMGTAAFLIATAALQPSIADLQVAIVGVRFFGLFRGVFRYLERLASHRLTLRLLTRLRVWFFEALEPLAPARTLELKSADLLTRAVADVESLQEFYIRVLAAPLVAVTVAAGTALFLGAFDPRLAAPFAAAFAAGAIAVPLVVRHLGRPLGLRLATTRADLGAAIVDGVQGMADLLAFGRGQAQRRRIEALSATVSADRERAACIEALGSAAITFVTQAAVWGLLVLAIPMVREGVIDGVSLAVICLVGMAAFEAVQPLPAAAQYLEEQVAAARRVFTILDARPAVRDPEEPVSLPAAPGLEVNAVDFIYPKVLSPALSGLNLELPAGRRLAVVGPSGAGKSTLAYLLLRFWDPSAGTIRLAEHSLPDYRLEDLRRIIGVLSQRTDLFTGTVRENLLLAHPEANQGELDAAARKAELLTTIRGLPEGWDTWIGEQGLQLSGGQRRRLAIARLLLRDPPILVLDEPAAGLDAITERRLLRTLHELMEGRTTILITHRLVGMEDMDEILVLDQGRVVERGTHESLLAREGLYRQQYEAQYQVLS